MHLILFLLLLTFIWGERGREPQCSELQSSLESLKGTWSCLHGEILLSPSPRGASPPLRGSRPLSGLVGIFHVHTVHLCFCVLFEFPFLWQDTGAHRRQSGGSAARWDPTQRKAVQGRLPVGRMNEGLILRVGKSLAASHIFIFGCTLIPSSRPASSQEVFLVWVALQTGQGDPELSPVCL